MFRKRTFGEGVLGLAFLLLFASSAHAQDFVQSYNFINTGTNGPTTSFANTGITSFFISWAPQTTMASCAVQVDSSSDGVTYGSGDLIASQNCATAGSSGVPQSLASGKNFIRIHVTALTGNGGLNVTLKGWGGAGSGGGSASPTGNLAGFVQTVACTGTGTSVACPSMSVTAGDMLFIGGATASFTNATSVTDSLGDAFTQVPGSSGTAFYASVNVSGNDVVTLNFAASQTPSYALAEYSGVATPITIDQSCFSSALNGSFITTTCANVTTSSNELLIGFGKAGASTWSTFPPYTIRTSTSAVNVLEDAFQPAASPVAGIVNTSGSLVFFYFVSFNALPRSNPSLYAAFTQGSCSGNNCFQVKSGIGFGGPFDTRESLQGTWSSNGTAITSPDANFSPAYNGMACWGSPQSMQAGPAAPGTFTYSTPTTGTCTPAGSMVGSAAANGVFTFGHDDTAVLVAATAAMFNQPKCGGIQLPFARGQIKQGLSFTGTVAADCGVQIIGGGYATTIEIRPDFSFSAVTSNVGCISLGCFWNTTAATSYNFFTISGEYNSLSGVSTAPASALFTNGPGSLAYQVNLNNWATATSNVPKGANVNGTGPFGIGVATTNWGDGNIWCSGTYCIGENDGGNATLKTQGSSLSYDYSGTYGGVYTTGSGAEAHLYGTTGGANSGGFGAMSCDHNGGELVFLEGGKVGLGTPGVNGIGFQFNNLGSGAQCKLSAQNTLFNGGASGAAINSAAAGLGTFVDRGGNTFNGPMTGFTGTYVPLAGGSMITRFVSATTNFGSNLTAQTLVGSVVGTTNLEIKIGSRQITAGVGCGAGSNTVLATLSFTAPGGTVTTLATTTLSISANGAVDSGAAAFQSLVIPVKVGTAVTFTTTSVLASAGCSTTPQYAIEVNI